MLGSLTAWLDQLPAAWLALLFCVAFVGITWLGILLIHPVMRRLLHGEHPSNEVIASISGGFGLLYAVLLGLLAVATFQNTKDVEDDVGGEASSLSAIYRNASGYPEPARGELKFLLRDYTHYVIEKDWPAHRKGLVLAGGEHRLQVIRQTLLSFEPASKAQETLQNELLHELNALTAARERRLAAVTATIPSVLWYVVVGGALISIAFLWMLYMELAQQLLLGGITGLFLGVMIFVIYAMDHPLRGAVSVTSEPFKSVYNLVMRWDARQSDVPAGRRPEQDKVFASIGTGELNGVYYSVGRAICQVVNRELVSRGVRCSAEATPGSEYNIEGVRSGELEFGIVQADVQFMAYNGKGMWTGRPFSDLRSVFSLHRELATLVVRSDSGIADIAGLAGRRVNIGSPGSGTRATWDTIEAALGWRGGMRIHPSEITPDATTRALCTRVIDANFLMVGYPSPLVSNQLTACPTKLVPITGPVVDKIIATQPYYRRYDIPGDVYEISEAVPTFGGNATLVTSTAVPSGVVDAIAATVLAHLDELRSLHPALAHLDASEMTTAGLTAPLDSGAEQAYRQVALIK
ncbi:MAG TPA: TAXI family TRAP transporter solute-binding subunit [Stellaceae bacterium]|nr:TAXI family TRAP transporter solute-binding subunit [Stellaceae bacterium]